MKIFSKNKFLKFIIQSINYIVYRLLSDEIYQSIWYVIIYHDKDKCYHKHQPEQLCKIVCGGNTVVQINVLISARRVKGKSF